MVDKRVPGGHSFSDVPTDDRLAGIVSPLGSRVAGGAGKRWCACLWCALECDESVRALKSSHKHARFKLRPRFCARCDIRAATWRVTMSIRVSGIYTSELHQIFGAVYSTALRHTIYTSGLWMTSHLMHIIARNSQRKKGLYSVTRACGQTDKQTRSSQYSAP